MIFRLLSIACIIASSQQQSENDNMCKTNGGILCVKEQLTIIATIAKGIARKSIEIETDIKQTIAADKLDQYINTEMDYTRFRLPTTQYHDEFFRVNNIDREYLRELFAEAHNAMIYFYNSIDNLLNLEAIFGEKTDKRLKEIQDNIQYEIICRYRSVLNVYSQKWKSANEIDRMQFSGIHRLSPSVIHEVRSVVIARYLRQWMEEINNVIINLETKFS